MNPPNNVIWIDDYLDRKACELENTLVKELLFPSHLPVHKTSDYVWERARNPEDVA